MTSSGPPHWVEAGLTQTNSAEHMGLKLPNTTEIFFAGILDVSSTQVEANIRSLRVRLPSGPCIGLASPRRKSRTRPGSGRRRPDARPDHRRALVGRIWPQRRESPDR